MPRMQSMAGYRARRAIPAAVLGRKAALANVYRRLAISERQEREGLLLDGEAFLAELRADFETLTCKRRPAPL